MTSSDSIESLSMIKLRQSPWPTGDQWDTESLIGCLVAKLDLVSQTMNELAMKVHPSVANDVQRSRNITETRW